MTGLTSIDALSNPAISSLRKEDSTVAGSAAEEAGAKVAKNFDEFMLLLTTQLQNQDPTEPLDTNQFTQQLATLSSVEQSVQTNKNLEKLISLTGGNQVSSAVDFIGKTVEIEGTTTTLKNGRATFAADLPAGTASVTMGIVDAAGRPVFTSTGAARAGRQDYVWDGTRSLNGTGIASDGQYTFGVVARDAAGKILQAKTYTTGRVSGVAMADGEVTLSLESGQKVLMQDVSSVRETPVFTANDNTNIK
jgi:flagellar basal-body rod modification protein FlgD